MKLLEDIDELLAYLEDTAHGEEGKRITEMRYRIQAVINGPASASALEGEQLGNEGSATKPVRWDCKVCGKSFDENYELYDHYDTVHNKGAELL